MEELASRTHNPGESAQPPSNVQAQDRSASAHVGRVLRDLLATSKAFFSADHHTGSGLYLPLVHIDRDD